MQAFRRCTFLLILAAASTLSPADSQNVAQPPRSYIIGSLLSDIPLEDIRRIATTVAANPSKAVSGSSATSIRSDCKVSLSVNMLGIRATEVLTHWKLEKAYDSVRSDQVTIFTRAKLVDGLYEIYYFSVVIDPCSNGSCDVTVQANKFIAHGKDGVLAMSTAKRLDDEISGDLINSVVAALSCT